MTPSIPADPFLPPSLVNVFDSTERLRVSLPVAVGSRPRQIDRQVIVFDSSAFAIRPDGGQVNLFDGRSSRSGVLF